MNYDDNAALQCLLQGDGGESSKVVNGLESFIAVCRLSTASNLSDAKHPEGPLSQYQHIDGVVSKLMTLDGQITDIDIEEKQ